MSNKQNEEWLEAVKECLLEMTVDIHVFNQALNGQTGADVIAKYGNYPPHYGYSEPTDDPEPPRRQTWIL